MAILKLANENEKEKQQNHSQDKIECAYLCSSLADRIVTITDNYGYFLKEEYLCSKCYEKICVEVFGKSYEWRPIIKT